MQNIERREPDPSLFQIPSDYTILKRAEGNRDLSTRPDAEPPEPHNPH